MLIGKVCGAVVSTHKNPRIQDAKLLLVEAYAAAPGSPDALKPSGRLLVTIDCLGAGRGEYVLITQGSSARMTDDTEQMPVDAVVIGIVESIRVQDRILSRADGTLVS